MHRRTLLAGLAGLALAPGLARAQDAGWDLVTPEEAAARRMPRTRRLTTVTADGPDLLIHAPQGSTIAPPVTFDVEFRGRDGVAPVMGSLRIDYDMGLFWQDVTQRLLSHATVEGTRLRAAGARLPPGRHVLRIAIMDKSRRRTVSVLDLTVAGG